MAPHRAPTTRIRPVLLTTINSSLPILGVSDFWQRAVVGALILAAVVLDRVLSARQTRRLAADREAPTDPPPTASPTRQEVPA